MFNSVQYSIMGSVKRIGNVIGGVASSVGGAIISRASNDITKYGEDLESKFTDKEAAARKAGNAKAEAQKNGGLIPIVVFAVLGFFVLKTVRVRG